MANLNSNKRRSQSAAKYVVSLSVISLVLVFLGGTWACMRYQQVKKQVNQLNTNFQQLQGEVDVLRTLEPGARSDNLFSHAASSMRLQPGWVVRVHKSPDFRKAVPELVGSDLGSFVMDESRFHLARHRYNQIERPPVGAYQMNGVYPSLHKGRHQFVLSFNVNRLSMQRSNEPKVATRCFASLRVNGRELFSDSVNLYQGFRDEALLNGEISLEKGMHPIAAVIFCDISASLRGEDVEVVFKSRAPGDATAQINRNSVFHVARPQHELARLMQLMESQRDDSLETELSQHREPKELITPSITPASINSAL
ncbi:hypothetical protein [Corallincola spongiicola]|uniref:Uncharacterized protein n=1 Tax=Corallincola spongiicola TaxID=2520508 RepID=A0ABY1WP73_9GAMM|nr:hypothetical protein [Corallincola spongiicola]TAA45874.1 hypothetical protein EXY25_10995 [Corallincola spongiicola]